MSVEDDERRIIAVGADHAGYRLKEAVKADLERRGYHVLDMGTFSEESCDYPDIAGEVARAVSRGEAERGVLVCGTGAGMAMVANKVPGVRAAACNEDYTASFSRSHNDANVLTMGARIISEDDALRILGKFLETPWEGLESGGDRHVRRLERLLEIERENTLG